MKDPTEWIDRDTFAAYVGEESEKILAFYDKAVKSKNMMKMAFNPLAIFVLPAWLGYRRQWAMWATLIGVIAVITLVEIFGGFTIPMGAFGGGLIALGAMSNGLLLMTANSDYQKLKNQGMTPEQIKSELQGKAAPSVVMAIGGVVGAFGILFVLTFLATMIAGVDA